jgi:hypothetical protein
VELVEVANDGSLVMTVYAEDGRRAPIIRRTSLNSRDHTSAGCSLGDTLDFARYHLCDLVRISLRLPSPMYRG